MTQRRQWLRSSPAGHYEYPKLELSRAWESLDSLRPSSSGEGKTPHFGFLNGNEAAETLVRINSGSVGFSECVCGG